MALSFCSDHSAIAVAGGFRGGAFCTRAASRSLEIVATSSTAASNTAVFA